MIYNRTCFLKSLPESMYKLAANTNRAIKPYQADAVPDNTPTAHQKFQHTSNGYTVNARQAGRKELQHPSKDKRYLNSTLKIAGYAAIIVLSGMDATLAGLDEQVGKANALILGDIATMILGGGVVFGGATAALKGNLMQAMAIIGTGGIIGIGTALAKNGQIFSILN